MKKMIKYRDPFFRRILLGTFQKIRCINIDDPVCQVIRRMKLFQPTMCFFLCGQFHLDIAEWGCLLFLLSFLRLKREDSFH